MCDKVIENAGLHTNDSFDSLNEARRRLRAKTAEYETLRSRVQATEELVKAFEELFVFADEELCQDMEADDVNECGFCFKEDADAFENMEFPLALGHWEGYDPLGGDTLANVAHGRIDAAAAEHLSKLQRLRRMVLDCADALEAAQKKEKE